MSERVKNPRDPSLVEPDVVVPRDRSHDQDAINSTSAESFPASDPPSWSGSTSVPADRSETPPEGEQASWSVEREARRPDEASDGSRTELEQTEEPGAELPVPPEDVRDA